MTCARADELLALHVGSDLGRDQARAVEAHLGTCPRCSAEAAAYARSQSLIREAGPAPFEAGDYAEIRREVRERLAAEALRGTFVRRVTNIFLEGKRGTAFVLAAAASLLLVAGIALRPSQPAADPAAGPKTASIARAADGQAEAQPLHPSKKNPPLPPESTSVVRTADTPALFPSKQKHLVADKQTLLVSAAIPATLSRIELQTTNPNVRIIWLVGAQPARPPETDSEDGI